MKPTALILCLAILFCTWPHRQVKAEEKVTVIVCLGMVAVIVGGVVIYGLVKVCKKKFPPPPRPTGTNNIPTNGIPKDSITASGSLNFTSVAEADQWLSLIPASTGNAQIEVEWTTNFLDWQRLPAVTGSLEDFVVIHSNPPAASCFYRVRVGQ